MTGSRFTGVTLLMIALVLAGCGRERDAGAREVDRSLVTLDTARMNLRQDRIGHGTWATAASFVLVDAENKHREDLMITLAGSLVDGSGQVVGALRPAS
ncbi:MAG TPA: hypothetical protein VNM90_15645, partial [Haliangium sp.]|nr:hypothetical protein [Haliangium sp.]